MKASWEGEFIYIFNKIFKSVAVLLSLIMITPSISYASENEESVVDTFLEMNSIGSISEDVSDENIINEFIFDAKEKVISKEINLAAKDFTLDYYKSKVLKIYEENDTFTSITIPVKGNKYSLISNLTLIYDANNNLVSYTETLLSNNNNKFKIESYINGSLLEIKDTNVDFVEDSEIQKGLDELHEIAENNTCTFNFYSVKKTAACIAGVIGVNAGVAYLIAGTCTASCPAVPPICAACIGAVATIGAGDLASIIACFKLD